MVERSVKELVTPETLNKILKPDFNERHCKESEYSLEDKKFMEKMERYSKYVDGR